MNAFKITAIMLVITAWAIGLKAKAESAFDYRQKGWAALHQNRPKQAIALFDKALALDPNYEDIYVTRGDCYRDLGNAEMALRDYDQAMKLNPKNPGIYLSRGVLYRQMADNDQAIKEFTHAL